MFRAALLAGPVEDTERWLEETTMSVQEMIAKLPELSQDERRQLQDALATLPAASDQREESDEERRRRGEAIWDRLMSGLVTGGGEHLSADIDAALYGEET